MGARDGKYVEFDCIELLRREREEGDCQDSSSPAKTQTQSRRKYTDLELLQSRKSEIEKIHI